MDPRHVEDLVLGTVNAPYREPADASALAAAIRAADPSGLPQLHSLFSDVAPRLTILFALEHGISCDDLHIAYRSYLAKGGLPYPNFERGLEGQGRIRKRALEVFEDEAKAERWLSSQLAVLGHQSPEVVGDSNPDVVINILEKIAWGVPP